MLVPGGLLVASIPNVRHWSVLLNLIEGRWTYEPAGILDRTHLRFFVYQSMIGMLSEAGFALEQVAETNFNALPAEPLGQLVSAMEQLGLDVSTLGRQANVYQYIIKCRVLKNAHRPSGKE